MANYARIQAKASKGYAKDAQVLGQANQHYRPEGPSDPVDPETLLGTVSAFFATEPTLKLHRPGNQKSSIRYGAFDYVQTQVGDYLVAPDGTTHFIGSQDPLLVALCILCNATLTFYRPTSGTPGSDFYGGNPTSLGEPLMTGWPASLLKGSKGERGDDPLPGDTRLPWMETLLPAAAGVTLRTDDLVLDDEGRRFIVSTAELSALGWRLELMFAGT